MIKALALIPAIAATTVACGRVYFDPLDPVGSSDARAGDGPLDSTPVPFAYVASIERASMPGNSDTFMWQASAAGNAILLSPSCAATATPTLSVTAPGWTFGELAPLGSAGGVYGTTVGAVAPDTTPVTITISWQGVSCGAFSAVGDELTGNDVTGGATTFEAVDLQAQVANCTASVTTVHDGALVWTSCTSSGTITAVPSGYTKAGDDTTNDWSAYRIANAGGTVETPTWQSGGVTATITALVAIKPR